MALVAHVAQDAALGRVGPLRLERHLVGALHRLHQLPVGLLEGQVALPKGHFRELSGVYVELGPGYAQRTSLGVPLHHLAAGNGADLLPILVQQPCLEPEIWSRPLEMPLQRGVAADALRYVLLDADEMGDLAAVVQDGGQGHLFVVAGAIPAQVDPLAVPGVAG